MQGLLLIDKPSGWTSFDAVNFVRRIVATHEVKKSKNVKVGHCGTLDPFATGLLILLIGKDYTKLAQDLSKLNKTYEVEMELGTMSSTGDPEGELKVVSKDQPSEKQVKVALDSFIGNSKQLPPKYSAIKINGVRAYKLARAGKEVQLEPRNIHIESINLKSYDYPIVSFAVTVSSGTYIRSLVEDIGQKLGTSAYTRTLRRSSIGSYEISMAISLNKDFKLNLAQIIENNLRSLNK